MDPGPIEVLDPSRWDLTITPAPAAAEEQALEQELDALGGLLDQDVGDLGALLETDWRPELEQLQAEAEEGIRQDWDCGDLAEMEAALVAAEETGWMINDAFVATPEQAWQDLPEPFTPPPETGGFTPEPEPGVYVPPPGVYVPPPQPPGPAAPTVLIWNVTRGDRVNFYVGDAWRITITGPPNSEVTVGGWIDGVAFTRLSYGYTDGAGNFRLEGRMYEGCQAYWVETWQVGGQATEPEMLGFFVL